MIWNKSRCALAVLLAAMAVLQGCTDKAVMAPPAPAAAAAFRLKSKLVPSRPPVWPR